MAIALFQDGLRSVRMLRLISLRHGETLPLPIRPCLFCESVARMPRSSCLAGIDRENVALFTAVLKQIGVPLLASVAHLNVVELGALKPALLVCDIDKLPVDPLEFLRQLRFVLPACIIVVYTAIMKRAWSVECHLAGANGLLLKESTKAELVLGVRGALRNGCFTDPRFAAASIGGVVADAGAAPAVTAPLYNVVQSKAKRNEVGKVKT